MGCCPSKPQPIKAAPEHASGGYDEYDPPTERIDVVFWLSSERAGPVRDGAAAATGGLHAAPGTMLMDRGDGCAIERSEYEATDNNNDPNEEDNQQDHETGLRVRPAEATAIQAVVATDAPIDVASPAIPPADLSVLEPHEEFPPASQPVPGTTTAPSPVRPSPPPLSPSKRPVNFDDVPINSMYHRIHVVEVEEMEAKRRQEQREEAERREREIEEFKAAMRAANER